MKDYYNILSVSRNATKDDIKKAYRKLAVKYHPDKLQSLSENEKNEAEEKFKEINEAYNTLHNDRKRVEYDRDISLGEMSFMSSHPTGMQYKMGKDISITVNITPDDIFNGCHKKIKINKKCRCKSCSGSGSLDGEYLNCDTCGGFGWVMNRDTRNIYVKREIHTCTKCGGTGKKPKTPCIECGGKGVVKGTEIVEFDIPRGFHGNMVITIKGKGNCGEMNGVHGDLFVKLNDTPSETGLERDENGNLFYDMNVKFTELVFGKNINVPWIGTKFKVKIKKGTQSGTVLRLKGKGLPDIENGTVTDYLIKVNCLIPNIDALDESAVSLLEELSEKI